MTSRPRLRAPLRLSGIGALIALAAFPAALLLTPRAPAMGAGPRLWSHGSRGGVWARRRPEVAAGTHCLALCVACGRGGERAGCPLAVAPSCAEATPGALQCAPTHTPSGRGQRGSLWDQGRGPDAAMTTLRAYARAFATDNYDALWALLTPTARAVWSGPAAYASFLRLKFAPVKLLDTSLGAPVQDGAALRVPLTLDLAWRAGNGPPGVLALLRNLPVRLVPTRDGWRVDGGGPLDPEAPVIPPTTLPARGLRVPILMYHHVSNLPPLAQSQVGLTVKTSDFAAQLAYLAGHGYHTVRLVDLFDALYYRRALPSRPVILTFDDGYADNYTDAFPLLRRDHMVGVFNIITNFPGRTVGVNSYMTWARIEAMAAAGMEMESHTAAHQDLGLINKGEAEYELDASRAALTAHIHRAVQVLCYPSGEPFRSDPTAARARILGLLPHFGYVGALLDPVTPGTLQDARAPYELPRVRVSNDEPLTAFAASLRS